MVDWTSQEQQMKLQESMIKQKTRTYLSVKCNNKYTKSLFIQTPWAMKL